MATFIAATILALGILYGLALLALYVWRRDLYDQWDYWYQQPPWWRGLAITVTIVFLVNAAVAVLTERYAMIVPAFIYTVFYTVLTLVRRPWQERRPATTVSEAPAAPGYAPVLWPLAPELVVTLLGMAMAGLLLAYVVLLTVRH